MKSISIRLKGFRGFRVGLGLEDVSIDFRSLPNGLIAIVGSNGMGKTTLLDNLHPYRIMPYKLRESKEWSPGSFSYYDQCYGRDALKEYVFEMDGKRFKSVIIIDAERRKQEAYLFVETSDGNYLPYNDAVKSGKTGAYDSAIEELVGSPSLFFSTSFRSQDARKLSSYPRSEILSIVCELLNIDNIKAQGEKASKVVIALSNLVNDLEVKKASIHEMLDSKSALELQRRDADKCLEECELSIKGLKNDLTVIEKQIRELELANASQVLTRTRVSELRQRHELILETIIQQEELLRTAALEHTEELSSIDSEVAKVVSSHKYDINILATEEQQERDEVKSELSAIAVKKQSLKGLLYRAEEINQAVKRVGDIEKELLCDRTQVDNLRAVQYELEASVSGLSSTHSNIVGCIKQTEEEHKQDISSIALEEVREKSQYQQDLAAIVNRKESFTTILDRADEINAAVAREQVLTAQLAIDSPQLEEMRIEAANLRVELAALASVDNEILAAQSRLANLHDLAGGLKGLDCHNDGKMVVNKTCKLLAAAVDAEKTIPLVKKEIVDLRSKKAETIPLVERLTNLTKTGTELADRVKAHNTELFGVNQTALLFPNLTNAAASILELTEQGYILEERHKQRIAEISVKLESVDARYYARHSELLTQKVETEIKLDETGELLQLNRDKTRSLMAQIAESEIDFAATHKISSLLPELTSASSRLSDLSEQDSKIALRLQNRISDIACRLTMINSRSEESRKTLVNKKTAAEKKWVTHRTNQENYIGDLNKTSTNIAEETRKLEATLDGELGKEIAQLNDLILSKSSEIDFEENLLKKLHAKLGGIKGQLEEMLRKEADLVQLNAKILEINAEMVNWKILAKAFSNDGIIALELDDAGPSIAAIANDLLYACYGPRFSVRLETQSERSDGSLKEVFDITVFDAERDEVKSIRDMSGGEITYIEDAITRAFSLYNINRTDRKYSTLYSDEKDGSLDIERKFEFLSIKRRALEIGAHDQEIFITQTPDLYELADARIVLESGSIQVLTR